LTYTPNANFNGTDTFTFKVNDGTVDSNTATVTITVTPVNDIPVANNQSVTVTEDTPKAITLVGSDVETTELTYIIVASPTRGTLSGTGSNITYTPNLNFNGSDSFTFKVNDGTADSNTATVSITVTAVNDAPIASSQFVFTNEDTALPILLFASDADGNPLTYAVVDQPQHGTLSCLDCRTPVYTPAANYNGPDSFTFKANDGTVDSNIATVNITVNAVNDAPVALNQSITVVEDTPASITLTGTDTEGATLSYTVITQPTEGVLSGTAPNLTYTPNANVFGSDSFTFRVNDGTLNSNIATVSIVITPVNDLPVAVNDAATTAEDTPVSFNITGNDTDVDGTIDPATVDLDPSTQATDNSVTIAGQGTFAVDATGLVTFTPVLNYNGSVTALKYTVKDNDGGVSNEGVISITVTPVNDVPVINATTVSTNEDQSVTVCFTVTDVENDPVTFTSGSSSTGNGTVTIDPASGPFCFTYKPNADFNGTDTIGVGVCEVNDSELCGTGSITINVLPVNDKPVALVGGVATDKITQTTAEDTALDFCFNVTDVEGNPISLSEITNVSGGGTLTLGTTVVAGKLCLSFTPVANFFGTSVWTGKLCDDQSGCSTITFEITVTPVNDIPVAQSLTITTPEDTPKAITLGGTDIDNDPVTVTIVTQPTNGTLSGTGAVRTYTPNSNYSGPDSFTYKINDGKDDSEIATVSITVTPVNDAPQIQQVNILSIPEDTEGSICIGVLDADGDQLTFDTPVNVSGGGTMVTDPEFGFCWIFKSAPNYNGNSFWKFKVCDNANPKLCSEITVQVIVTPVNDPPVARNDELTVKSYELSETINLLANDSDIDGDQLQVNLTPVLGPFHAKDFTISAGGAFQYRSALGYIGLDSVKFKICDKGTPSLCDEATVFIEVTPAPFRIFEGLSPNDDGFNDYWRINGIEAFPDNRVRVFDRYGNLVYDAIGYDNAGVQWRGQANVGIGGTLPDATYFYIVDINDGNGPYSGYVVLKSN
ncbi:MAG: tandem-95 repeat protein, partial [Bacteroidota bacterium]